MGAAAIIAPGFFISALVVGNHRPGAVHASSLSRFLSRFLTTFNSCQKAYHGQAKRNLM
jgi:hypothetical protein